MALSFATNSLHLANRGFSIGDISVLAGAGRHVITWLTAEARDHSLLDFLKVAPSDLDFRRGLIDPIALNKRWSRKVALFRNGRRVEMELEGEKNDLENVSRFTWTMILIVVCLDETVTEQTLQSIIVNFTEALFASSTLEIEYLQHEIPQHIKGWRSTACVRMMVPRARDIWRTLEREKKHLPGYIPDSEKDEVVRFLQWLVIGGSATFTTASSDVYSLAILLSQMGFDCLRTSSQGESFPDTYAVVAFDRSVIPSANADTALTKRHGMRIPLESMEEAVSLWPGTSDANNHRRSVFRDGVKAASGTALGAVPSPFGNRDTDPGILATSLDSRPLGRVDTEVNRLAKRFLLVVNPIAFQGVMELVQSWRIHDPEVREVVISALTDVPMAKIPGEEYAEYKGDLQIFLLGYYYGMLRPIMDVSQLSVKEGFGSWGWYDSEFFDRVSELVKSGLSHDEKGNLRRGILFWRFQILRMAVYLFGGAETDQIQALNHGAAGLHAKLTLIIPALLGDADTPEKITKLYLLDIDPTCIPSNGLGVIMPGKQSPAVDREPASPPLDASALAGFPAPEPDFTSHIEPAWGYDPNLCLVAYRHQGRLVHKIDPTVAEAAVLEWWAGSGEREFTGEVDFPQALQNITTHALSQNRRAKMFAGSISNFYSPSGGCIIYPTLESRRDHEVDSPMWVYVLPTTNLSKARTCIAAMYSHRFDSKAWGWTGTDFSWDECSPSPLVVGVSGGEGVFGTGTVILL
jgi:hypothetical protein